MKKLLFLALSLLPIGMLAQSTVYFGNLSKTTSIGFGSEENDVIISIMEMKKSKEYDGFELVIYGLDNEKQYFEMKEDTVYHLKIDKTYAHQKDFKLSRKEYGKLLSSLGSQTYAKINGDTYNGAAVAGVLRSLEVEQGRFRLGQLSGVQNVSIWNWNAGVEMMRFRHAQLPRNREFRYIRTLPPRRPQMPQLPQRPQEKK